MASGRKEKVMIACVTFDTVKIAEPVEYYESNRIHLLHHSKPGTIYQDFYDQTVKLIMEKRGSKAVVIEHTERVWIFKDMLRTIISIIDSENGDPKKPCEIMINISAGSPEYSAAATIASMMYDNVQAFAVSAEKYTVGDEGKLKELYYVDSEEKDANGKAVERIPVGFTFATREPVSIANYEIKKPERKLVRGLREYYNMTNRNGRVVKVRAPEVVKVLSEKKIWTHDRSTVTNEAVYFHREFIQPWLDHGWIEKDEYKRYIVTPEGVRTFQTFYLEEKDIGEDWLD